MKKLPFLGLLVFTSVALFGCGKDNGVTYNAVTFAQFKEKADALTDPETLVVTNFKSTVTIGTEFTITFEGTGATTEETYTALQTDAGAKFAAVGEDTQKQAYVIASYAASLITMEINVQSIAEETQDGMTYYIGSDNSFKASGTVEGTEETIEFDAKGLATKMHVKEVEDGVTTEYWVANTITYGA